jgi:K+/H+ antiporter YhaU regulatory subunit KhtT
MSLIFVCETCGEHYEATISGIGIVYINKNKREVIATEKEPCEECKVVIKKAEEEAKQKIRTSRLHKTTS